MSDVKNKHVNIYIDQQAAINAFDNLQKKADGFNKKIDEAKEKQKQLLETINKSKAAAENIDALRKNYSDLSKEIENNKKKLAENNEEKKKAKDQLQLLSNQLIDARDKQRSLADAIANASEAGKGTKRLEVQYAAVTREIERTIEKIHAQDNAFQKASVEADHYAKEISGARVQQKALREEIKLADGATRTIKNAENNYRSLEKSIEANTKSAKKYTDAQAEIKSQMDKGLRPSLEETKNLVTKLRNELSRMSEDAPGYAEKFDSFQKARTELDRLQNSMNGVEKAQRSWLQEAKIVAFGVLIGNTVQSAVQAVGSYLSGIVTGNAKLSDSLADVEKATGLSKQGVESLNKQLGKIDTRTKAADLREIAVGLGQIGEQADKANVEAIDKIVVALGDEFGGGAREITTTLSVLRNNLQDLKTGNYSEDVLHIGNALNVLGAEGLATAPVVTDIANRIAGIAQTYKLSSGQILGVAATFQELGIETERGSTAITRIFQKIGAEPAKFAKVAGVGVKEFKNLVNTDMLGAFQKVAEGVQKAGGNNIVFSKILKELDADGSGAGEVLSKLGSNAELLAKKVSTATIALKDGSSITEEFGKKNTTLGAELDKLQKKVAGLIQSKTLTEFFSSAVISLSKLIDVLRAAPKWFDENKTAVYLIIAGIALLNASYIKAGVLIARDTTLKIYNATVTRLTAAATNIAAAAQITYGLIVDVVTGKMKLAAAASAFYSVVLKSSLGPIGIIITLVGAAAVAVSALTDKTKSLTAAQKLNNEVQSKVSESTATEISNIDLLAKVAGDANVSLDNRKKALQELINISPSYLKGLTLENISTAEGKRILDGYVASLKEKAEIEAKSALLTDKLKEKDDLFLKARSEGIKLNDEELTKALSDPNSVMKKGGKAYNDFIQALRRAGIYLEDDGKKIKDNLLQIKSLQDDITSAAKKDISNVVKVTTTTNTNVNNPLGDKKTPEELAAERKAKKEQAAHDKLLKELEDFQFELQQVGKQADESEIDRIGKKYNELTVKATRYGLSLIEIEKEKNRAVAYLVEQEQKKREDAIRKINKAADEETYKNFQETIALQGEQQKEAETKRYGLGLINKRQLEEAIRRIDLETYNFQIGLAESFAGVSKQAATDLVTFKKKKNKEEIADAVATREQREALQKREDLAKAQLGVLRTRPDSKARLDAQLNLLKVERDNELKNTELTNSEKEKINEEYRQRSAQTTVEYYAKQVEQTLGFLSSGLDIISKLNDARSAKEKAALDKELKGNDARRNSIKRLEEQKVISSSEAKRKLAAIDKEEEAKKEALEKKQQARAKRIAIAQAIINGAMAITSTLAAIPGPTDILSLGTFRAIQIGLAIATTAAQIKTISDTKYGKGGRLTGPSHSNGGMPVINPVTGQKEAEVEGGEYILSKYTVANNREVADALLYNSMNRGGARIRSFWEARPYRTFDYPRINERMQKVKFATGGVFQDTTAPVAPAAPAPDPALLNALQQSNAVNIALLGTVDRLEKTIANGIEANVSLKKIDKARAQENSMKESSDFK